ncbi:MAG: hypothetical protein QME45_06675 [Clostridiales bacterium]|nr:hypothetical protein [Clostridiales bacterium]
MQIINKKKFVFRAIVFVFAYGLGIYNAGILESIFYYKIKFIRVYHILWAFLMLNMVKVSIPTLNRHISGGKMFAKYFKEDPGYSKDVLYEYIKKNNQRALLVAVLWVMLLFSIGFLYYKNIINKLAIHLIVVLFYFGDIFCINVWCPFRTFIVKSKCCNSCRIFNWGYFMNFSPYIFIPSFWTYSLVAMSLILLVQWEYLHHKYPYRFYEVSNLYLRCSSCLNGKCHYMNTKIL